MRENGNWGQDRGVVCRNCGATNPAGAAYCSSCGSRLGELREEMIDVSTGEPQLVTPEERGVYGWQGWGSERIEQGRVYVARGGRTTCLLLNLVFLLLICCTCWLLWNSVGTIF